MNRVTGYAIVRNREREYKLKPIRYLQYFFFCLKECEFLLYLMLPFAFIIKRNHCIIKLLSFLLALVLTVGLLIVLQPKNSIASV